MTKIRFDTDYWEVHGNHHAMVSHRIGRNGSNIFSVHTDVQAWLRHHVGRGCCRSDPMENRCYPSNVALHWRWDFMCLDVTYIEFEFKDPGHAMLFRLTWGGNSTA